MDKFKILKFLKEHKQELHYKFGIVKIGLFGSFARGENTKFSDVDIVVEFNKESKTLHSFLALKRFLETHLQVDVDLGLNTAIKPYIKDKILKEIIYA